MFLLTPKRKLNAFHKILRSLEVTIKQLISNASDSFPLPLIVKKGRKHYLINLESKIYGGIIDPHTKAFTKTYRLDKTPIKEITENGELFHCYTSHNKVFGQLYHRTFTIDHFNFDNFRWWDMNIGAECTPTNTDCGGAVATMATAMSCGC